MAPVHAIMFLGLAASSVLALPSYGVHSHGEHAMPTGSVRSHALPTGTRASSGLHSHSRAVESHKSSAGSEGYSSIDAIATSAAYDAQQTASTSCETVTTKIKVTVTITADETSVADVATSVTPVSFYNAAVVSQSHDHVHAHSRHHSSSSEATEAAIPSSTPTVESASTSTSLAAAVTFPSSVSTSSSSTSSSSATYAVPSSYSSTAEEVSSSIEDKIHRPVSSNAATSWPTIAATTHLTSATQAKSTSIAQTTAAATTSSSSSSSSSMPKRGLAYNDASLVSDFASSSNIGWAYNWGSSSGSLPSNIMYIPTLWSNTNTFTNSWVSNAKAAISKGSTHIFSFNEPDMTSQSNLTPEAAAEAYKTWISDEFEDNTNVKLCAPSVTNGVNSAGTMGLEWLASFLTLAKEKGARVDCVNIHWYGTDVSDLTSHVSQAISQANAAGISDVWLTEFGLNGSPSASTISTFLSSALPSLEQSSLTGYAYFMLSNNILVDGSALNAAGQTYLSSA